MEQINEHDFDRCISYRGGHPKKENTLLKKMASMERKKHKSSACATVDGLSLAAWR